VNHGQYGGVRDDAGTNIDTHNVDDDEEDILISLGKSFDAWYKKLKKYKKEHGTCNVCLSDDPLLFSWCYRVRKAKIQIDKKMQGQRSANGKAKDSRARNKDATTKDGLQQRQIKLLNSMGFDWEESVVWID